MGSPSTARRGYLGTRRKRYLEAAGAVHQGENLAVGPSLYANAGKSVHESPTAGIRALVKCSSPLLLFLTLLVGSPSLSSDRDFPLLPASQVTHPTLLPGNSSSMERLSLDLADRLLAKVTVPPARKEQEVHQDVWFDNMRGVATTPRLNNKRNAKAPPRDANTVNTALQQDSALRQQLHPRQCCTLTQLRWSKAKGQITLPAGCTELDLRHQELGDASVASLIVSLPPRITSIFLVGNHLGPEAATALANVLPRLRTLDLNSNFLGDEGVAILSTTLAKAPILESLVLSNNGIGTKGAVALASALAEANCGLRELRLTNNRVGDTGAGAILSSLQRRANGGLEHLALASNGLTDAVAPALAVALGGIGSDTSKHPLHTLDLGDNWLTNDGAQVVASGLGPGTRLHTLQLSGNRVGNRGASAVLHAMHTASLLRAVHLERNQVQAVLLADLRHLAKTRRAHQTSRRENQRCGMTDLAWSRDHSTVAVPGECRVLQLGGSKLGDKRAEAILSFLAESGPIVEEMQLMDCNISSTGAEAIAQFLRSPRGRHLQVLDLYANEVDDRGAIALARALRYHPGLKTLDLWGNQVGDSGASALARALQENSVLNELLLCWNHITDSGAAALGKALGASRNTSGLSHLSLWDNPVGVSGVLALQTAVADAEVTLNL